MLISLAGSFSTSFLPRFLGWQFIPNFATRQILQFYHRFLSSRGRTPPPPNSPAWQKHYRYTYALVIGGYMIYNFIEASRATPISFYELLEVTPAADEKDLKVAFRAFAKRYHPDRVGKEFESRFIAMRDAYDALKNPVTRFAYDRFGFDALEWRELSTPKEFLWRGLQNAAGFYIASMLFLVVVSFLMRPSPVAFWRYLLLFALGGSELNLILNQDSLGVLKAIFPYRVPYQHVAFLHQLFIFCSVAMTQVVPVLFPDPFFIRPEDPRTYAPFIERITALSKVADRELSRMLHTELHAMHGLSSNSSFSDMNPCQPSEEVLETLTREMENMIIEHQLRNEGPIRSIWDAAIRRRKGVEKRLEDILKDDAQEGYGGVQGFSERGTRVSTKFEAGDLGSPDLSAEAVKADKGRLPSPPESTLDVHSAA